MRSLRRIVAVAIGLVFAVSALFKLMDPVGTGLIVEEYFSFLHLDFLKPAALPIGIFVSLLEAALCAALVTGVWKKVSAVVSVCLLSFFTLLSVLLVIFNPDMSCGCFGKVIELTHAQTLFKNIVLLLLSAFAFFPLKGLDGNRADRYVAFGIAIAFFVAFTVYSLLRLPVVEHTEFAPDSHLVLSAWDEDGNDRSEDLLDGRVVAISVCSPEKIGAGQKNEIMSFSQEAYNAGWTPVLVSAGNMEVPGLGCLLADHRKLMTLNRSNGGVVFMDDGYIIRKYACGDYPSFEKMEEMCLEDPFETYVDYSTRQSLTLQGLFLAVIAIMFLV